MDPRPADPRRIADVEVLDAETVGRVIRQVEVSTDADQLAYRESEVDALWTLADMAARAGDRDAPVLLELLWEAHDHIGDGHRDAALTTLERLRERLCERGAHPAPGGTSEEKGPAGRQRRSSR
jgi:hypothetical protein